MSLKINNEAFKPNDKLNNMQLNLNFTNQASTLQKTQVSYSNQIQTYANQIDITYRSNGSWMTSKKIVDRRTVRYEQKLLTGET